MAHPTLVTACVIIIGNEILSGRTQDTNLAHLATTLNGYGVQVRHARVIPDITETIVSTLNEVRVAYDYVFTTGGIGPTHDDITADCVAAAFGVPLVLHPAIEAVIRQREAPPDVMAARLRMARVPQGATLIDNPTGGPAGFQIGNVFVMAGIPRVMQAMLSTLGEGRLRRGPSVGSRSVTCHLAESVVADGLRAIQDAHPAVDLGSYPFYGGERYGTTLVMRGIDDAELAVMQQQVADLVRSFGDTPIEGDRPA